MSVETVDNLGNEDYLTFDQWTRKYNDASSEAQSSDLSTQPMKYYINSLNNISATSEPNLAFTPIGNAGVTNIPNLYDRALPSNLNRGRSSTYTFPHSTSAFIGSTNNINNLNTDLDLTLKAGLTLRAKGSENDLSAVQYPHYGDLSVASEVVSNAGQYWNNSLSNRLNQDILGLNETMNSESQGIGGNYSLLFNQAGISTRNAMINYQNPGGKSGAQLKNSN